MKEKVIDVGIGLLTVLLLPWAIGCLCVPGKPYLAKSLMGLLVMFSAIVGILILWPIGNMIHLGISEWWEKRIRK